MTKTAIYKYKYLFSHNNYYFIEAIYIIMAYEINFLYEL